MISKALNEQEAIHWGTHNAYQWGKCTPPAGWVWGFDCDDVQVLSNPMYDYIYQYDCERGVTEEDYLDAVSRLQMLQEIVDCSLRDNLGIIDAGLNGDVEEISEKLAAMYQEIWRKFDSKFEEE